MQVRIIGNVWLDGLVIAPGTVIDIHDAEHLCKLGVAEPVPVSPAAEEMPRQIAKAPEAPIESPKPKPKKARRK